MLQRRLASSLGAIRSSPDKRAKRIGDRIVEIEALPPGERAARLAELRLVEGVDAEQDVDDATEEEADLAAESVVVAETLEQMRAEIARSRLASASIQVTPRGSVASPQRGRHAS